MKKVSRASKILEIVNENIEISCQNVMKKLHSLGFGDAKSDAVSSQLKNFVRSGKIKYSENTTSRGGHLYSPIIKPVLKLKINFHGTGSDN